MVYSCYLSKTSKLLYGIKDLMAKYTIRADSTVFFEYIGNSVFYATIFDEHGLEIFNDLPLKLILSSVVDYMTADLYVISDSDSEIGMLTFSYIISSNVLTNQTCSKYLQNCRNSSRGS